MLQDSTHTYTYTDRHRIESTHSHVHSRIHSALTMTLLRSPLIHPTIIPVTHSIMHLIESSIPFPTAYMHATAYAADAALPTPTALIHPDLIVIALPFCIAIAMAHLNCLLTCAAGTYD